MKKKALGFMYAATMTESVFAGCGGNQNEGNTNEIELLRTVMRIRSVFPQ